MSVLIKAIGYKDRKNISELVRKFWADEKIVVHGVIFHTSMLPGFKAIKDGEIIGFIHYQIRGEEGEIITLASIKQEMGIGSALVAEVEKVARKSHCEVLSVTTTNDNLRALGFYQRRGFHLAALFPGQVDQSRRLKPTIPKIGDGNIPIRDELRLKKLLD